MDYRQSHNIAPVNGEAIVKAVLGKVLRGLLALPDSLFRRVFGDPPPEAAGLRADSWAMARLTAREANREDYEPDAARRETEVLAAAVTLPVPEVARADFSLEGDGRQLDSRLFTPDGAPDSGPLLVHFHGGGWVQGSIESHSGACAWLAREAGVRVLSVEYRLAPEHRFPAQAEDALLAWKAVTADPQGFGADPARIGVSGDSAGAQMATVLCLDLKAAGDPQPACQLLIYPVTDCTGSFASRETFVKGYYLTKSRMDWFEECFLPEGAAEDPRASPLFASDLSGLAPANVSIAIADPLRDEGVAYADRLAEAGVEVSVDHMPMLHAWFNMTASRSTRHGHAVLAARVNELLRVSLP
ncbi:MAG: alpha/beta hydrolase [Solirubrobacterales bacterium]